MLVIVMALLIAEHVVDTAEIRETTATKFERIG
jgi:hypothetical protein